MATRSRVDDYLGDKIQTAADLGSINELLDKVREQQHLLRNQLSAAKSELSQADGAAQSLSQSLHARTSRFQHDQTDIDRRLRTLTQSKAGDDATQVFEAKMQRLRRLELATGYVEILQEGDVLVQQARHEIDNPPSAVAKYSRLCTLVSNLRRSRRAADEAAPHLLDHLDRQTQALFHALKQRLEPLFQQTLDKMQWPKKDLQLSGEVVETWACQVGWLLDLQEANVRVHVDGAGGPSSPAAALLPLEVMARPLILRFQYHFYGDRPTNRLDKPEYFFSHILDVVEQANPLMAQLLQPVLDARAQTPGRPEIHYPDAISAFITVLLPPVLSKCLSILPQITSQPQLLSHFMHESLAFDNTLRDSWAYTPAVNTLAEWRGVTGDVLVQHGYFDTWLDVEKSFALSRYQKIRENPESNQIEYDSETSRTKPTKGALRVNDLLETVTDRYRLLSSFSQKIKFFLDIQLSIFDDYHGYLHGALQAYLMASHTAGRLIQGVGQSQDDAMGIRGLESLVKIFGSAEYLERKMSDSSEDIFFLELWDELQDRAKGGNGARNGTLGRDLTIEDVASKTSASIKPDAQETEHESDGGALFDEISATYRKLRERTESEIVRALETQARNALKPYGRVAIWSSISTTAQNVSELTPSSSLDTLFATLSTLLTFLAGSLAASPLRRIIRPFCVTIQKDLVDTIIMKNTFSTAGALQLRRDVTAIQDIIDARLSATANAGNITSGESKRSMKKLEDVLTLLNLPIKQDSQRPQGQAHTATSVDTDTGDGENGWGFDDEINDHDDDDADENRDVNESSVERLHTTGTSFWNLWAFEKAIFASNESARDALVALRLDHLTESEARNVIRRRIELNA